MRLTTALILGSGSSTRKVILGEMGIPFTVDKPGIDEKAIRREEPSELVLALGLAKAAALLDGPNGATYASRGDLILTGDQVVVWKGQILEKPENEKEARAFIAGYGEAPPSTVGSCVVTDAATRRQWHAVDVATVHFRPIPEATVDKLLAEGEVYHCAGGLMVEHPLVEPHIERMDGEIDSVMGLRKKTVSNLLAQAEAARSVPASC